ncbi:hypothetical protein B6S44_02125 [Bosea sp. Tri-44]|uniref:hypothetical protein n=1 Tax=Bosea sp. Tri-44 TaxID=1972137 RepID=UPI00100DF6C9|nr:hypothetical protein [Bosea sp. Tri-44]RXT57254.1 hypothetical protein B6S44_02125 [Bosea sp. Tri-44]
MLRLGRTGGLAVQVDPSDVHQTLEYRLDAEFASWLPIGLLTCFCGLFIFALKSPGWPPPDETFGAFAAILVGIGLTAFALLRRARRGKPVYVLSPEGAHIRWSSSRKESFIPWHEIKGVDTIDITVRHWLTRYPQNLDYHDVTVVLVSKQFYQANLHIKSLFQRGPYWSQTNFIPRGDMIQCALHGELVSVEPQQLRAAVEARWRAFGGEPDRPRPSVPVVYAARWPDEDNAAAVPGRKVVAAGEGPRPFSAWDTVKIVLPLIGIVVAGSNLLGIWSTDAQIQALARKREWQEWNARYERERRELDERLRKQREEIDEAMRRAFTRY